jgi:hypothetical protein
LKWKETVISLNLEVCVLVLASASNKLQHMKQSERQHLLISGDMMMYNEYLSPYAKHVSCIGSKSL